MKEKVIIFDFDDTLHVGTDWTLWADYIEGFLTAEFKSVEKAKEFMAKYDITWQTNGQKIANALIKETGSASGFIKFQHDNIFPLTLNTVKHIDGELIKKLGEKYTIFIVSNNNVKYVKHYLKLWGININFFKNIYQNNFFKNNSTKGVVYEKILKNEKIQPHEAVVVGDSYKADIVPAQELGINALHIKSLYEVEEFIKKRL